jgi:hypothetical protein
MNAILLDTATGNMTDKKKSRQDAKVTRLDVRLPNDLHAQIEAIAKANGEAVHHITGNIILTPTVVKLIRLGISSLSGDYQILADMPSTTGHVSDKLIPRMDAIESEVSILKKHLCRLEDRLNGLIVSDGLVVLADTLPDNLPDISPDILTDNSAEPITDNRATDSLSDDVSDETTVKPMTEEVLLFLAGEKAAGKMKNKDAADWLLTNGYGSYDPTTISKKIKPYLSATP